jgi:hypothetical protein
MNVGGLVKAISHVNTQATLYVDCMAAFVMDPLLPRALVTLEHVYVRALFTFGLQTYRGYFVSSNLNAIEREKLEPKKMMYFGGLQFNNFEEKK